MSPSASRLKAAAASLASLALLAAAGPAFAQPAAIAPARVPVASHAGAERAAASGAPGVGATASVAATRPPRTAQARHRPASTGPLATIARANAQARDWPQAGSYLNSALYYDYEPGRLYTVHASPRFLTTITLKPGEKLIAKAAGDTVRWVLGETRAGAGQNVQVVIFVKPIRAGLRTNIVLTTDQRTYLIDALSTASGAYTSLLTWNYPQDLAREAAELSDQARVEAQARGAAQVAAAVPIDQLNFRYTLKASSKRAPRWMPVRVFDDGARTFIEFPADVATSEAPPLFLLGAEGQAELVNYRLSGVYYVVDRRIDRAELRLGARRQDIVRITRQGAAR